MKVKIAALAGLVLALLSAGVRADEPMVTRLANGLEVVIQRLDRAPVVALQVWVRAGSRLETGPERGITHFIEHMLFKGTPTRPLGRVAGDIEAVGGQINAYTSYDHTVYHAVLPAEHWAVGLTVWADALKNSLFDPQEVAREREVVLEEWRRSQDEPRSRLHEKLMATAFTRSSYRFPILGFKETIEKFDRKMILDYLAKWYTGERITVVVVGPVDPPAVLAKARECFGVFPARSGQVFEPAQDPPQAGLRLTAFNHRVKQAYLAMGFKIPGLGSPEAPALDLLAQLLSGGESGRLTEVLWGRAGVVNSVSATAFTPLDQGLFWVSLRAEPDKLKPALISLWRELFRVGREPFGSEDFRRAKLSFKADFIKAKATMQGQAGKLGLFQNLAGGLKAEKEYLDRVESLTATEIQALAAGLFRPEKATPALMLPEGDKLPDQAWLESVIAQARKEAAPPPKRPMAENRVQVYELPHGTRLLVQEDHSLPLWAVQAVFLGGTRLEPADKAGISKLLAACWTRGAGGLNAEDLARRIDDLAGDLSAFSGRNSLGLSGGFLSQFRDEGLDLFAQVLLRPAFDPQEVAKRRADQLAAIRNKKVRPQTEAFRLFREAVFAGHPYARDDLGEETSVGKLTAQDLKDFYGRLVRADNLVLAVVGDVSGPAVRDRLAALLAGLPAGFQAAKPAGPEPLPAGGRSAEEPRAGLNQVQVVLGFRGPALGREDALALDLLAAALNDQSGRLFRELRDEKSLAYSLAAFYSGGLDLGAFGFYIGSAPQKLSQVREELKAQLRRLLGEPLTQAEIDRARAKLTAEWVINRQTPAALAMDLALYERYGLGYDYAQKFTRRIKDLTPEAVWRAARKWLDPDKPVWVLVGPPPGK